MRAPVAIRLERFQQILNQIANESSSGSVIIVEGQKDLKSLRELGIVGPVLCLQSSRKNANEFTQNMVGSKKVIVLTDFDREGISLAKKLSRNLNAQNLNANMVLWKNLRELTRSDVRSIEELPKYLERLQQETCRKSFT